jgi:predicted ester cyclase
VPDWEIEIVGLAEQGDDVFVQWHMTGTHAGPLLGVAPTGKALAIDGIDHFVVRDGKIASNFVIVDQLQYARQIGMMPPDGSGVDGAMKSVFNPRTKLAEKLTRS